MLAHRFLSLLRSKYLIKFDTIINATFTFYNSSTVTVTRLLWN